MTTLTQPRTIRAIIDQNAITRVPAFFDASSEQILHELLQNSRRAGATRVDIQHIPDRTLIITDDGDGIDDPQTILSFGRSDWTDTHTVNEQPAGMGFYCLATQKHVSILSQRRGQPAWQINLDPDTFTGQQEAQVIERPDIDLDDGHGTIVNFQHDLNINQALNNVVRYYPIRVTLNGTPLHKDEFIEHHISITDWKGLRIAVQSVPDSNRYTLSRINFHGLVVKAQDILPQVPTIHSKHAYGILVDVIDCPDLALTLPTRDKVVRNAFCDELQQQCYHAIYQAIASVDDDQGISFKAQQHAENLAIAVKEPRPRLRAWIPDYADSNRTYDSRNNNHAHHAPGHKHATLQPSLETDVQHTLHRALQANPDAVTLLEQRNGQLSGYPWYDRIPTVTDVSVSAVYGVQQFELPSEEELPSQRPDAIFVTLQITTKGQPDRTLHLDTDLALIDHAAASNLGDIEPLITKKSDITVDELSQTLMDTYFSFSNEYNSDSYETQQENAEYDTETLSLSILQTRDDVLSNQILSKLKATSLLEMPPGTTVTATVTTDSRLELQITKAN